MTNKATPGTHWLHSWVPTLVGAGTLLGTVAAGGVAWSNMNHRLDTVETANKTLEARVNKLQPAPTEKEKQCEDILHALTTEMSSAMGNRIIELKQLATEMRCVPPPG